MSPVNSQAPGLENSGSHPLHQYRESLRFEIRRIRRKISIPGWVVLVLCASGCSPSDAAEGNRIWGNATVDSTSTVDASSRTRPNLSHEDPTRILLGDQFEIRIPGRYNAFDKANLTITSSKEGRFGGLLDKETYRHSQFIPNELSSKVEGTIESNGKIEFTVSEYNIVTNEFESQWKVEGVSRRVSLLNYWWISAKNKPPSQLYFERVGHLDAETIEQRHDLFAKALTNGRTQYLKHKQTIESLQANGHALKLFGLLNDGRLDLHWFDSLPEEKDHSVIQDLVPLKFINCVSVNRIASRQDLKYISQIPEIGHLEIRRNSRLSKRNQLQGDDLVELVNGNQIHSIKTSYIGGLAANKLATMNSLVEVEISIDKFSPPESFKPIMLRGFSFSKSLKRLHVEDSRSDFSDVIPLFRSCTSLESISIHPARELSSWSVNTINRLPNIKSLSVSGIEMDQLLKLDCPTLERLFIGKIKDFSEQALAQWDIPPRLKSFTVNSHWTPVPFLAYVKRLKTMSANERAMYSAVRFLKNVSHDYYMTDFSSNYDRLAILGAVRSGYVRDVERSSAIHDTMDAMSDVESSRIGYEKVMSELSRTIQKSLSTMVRNKEIPMEFAIEVQLEIHRFTGRILPEIESSIDERQKSILAEHRKSFLNTKKYKKSQSQ